VLEFGKHDQRGRLDPKWKPRWLDPGRTSYRARSGSSTVTSEGTEVAQAPSGVIAVVKVVTRKPGDGAVAVSRARESWSACYWQLKGEGERKDQGSGRLA
jgi:hypothetical protein